MNPAHLNNRIGEMKRGMRFIAAKFLLDGDIIQPVPAAPAADFLSVPFVVGIRKHRCRNYAPPLNSGQPSFLHFYSVCTNGCSFRSIWSLSPNRCPRVCSSIAQIACFALVVGYIWISLTCRKAVRVAFLALFALAVLGEYGGHYSVGRFSVSDDYDMVFRLFDPTLYKNAIVGFTSQVWPAGAVPILGYAVLLFGLPGLRQGATGSYNTAGSLGRFGVILLLALLLFSALYPVSSGAFRTLSLAASLRSLTLWAGNMRPCTVGRACQSRRSPRTNHKTISSSSSTS